MCASRGRLWAPSVRSAEESRAAFPLALGSAGGSPSRLFTGRSGGEVPNEMLEHSLAALCECVCDTAECPTDPWRFGPIEACNKACPAKARELWRGFPPCRLRAKGDVMGHLRSTETGSRTPYKHEREACHSLRPGRSLCIDSGIGLGLKTCWTSPGPESCQRL